MNVETHLLGSSDGYRTLAKSPGLLPGEEAALTVLNFGQVESSDLEQLNVDPVMHGRLLSSGRYAITRYLPGQLDDVGRPTIELRSIVMDVSTFIGSVRFGLSSLAGDLAFWGDPVFTAGSTSPVPSFAAVSTPQPADYALFDGWLVSSTAGSVAVIEGGTSGSADLLHLIGAIDPAVVGSVRWGVGLLGTDLEVDICTLLSGRRPSARRVVHWINRSGPVTTPSVEASRQSLLPPGKQSSAPSVWGSSSLGGDVSPIGLVDAERSTRSSDYEPWGDASSAHQPQKRTGFPLALIGGLAAALFVLVLGVVVVLILAFTGTGKKQEPSPSMEPGPVVAQGGETPGDAQSEAKPAGRTPGQTKKQPLVNNREESDRDSSGGGVDSEPSPVETQTMSPEVEDRFHKQAASNLYEKVDIRWKVYVILQNWGGNKLDPQLEKLDLHEDDQLDEKDLFKLLDQQMQKGFRPSVLPKQKQENRDHSHVWEKEGPPNLSVLRNMVVSPGKRDLDNDEINFNENKQTIDDDEVLTAIHWWRRAEERDGSSSESDTPDPQPKQTEQGAEQGSDEGQLKIPPDPKDKLSKDKVKDINRQLDRVKSFIESAQDLDDKLASLDAFVNSPGRERVGSVEWRGDIESKCGNSILTREEFGHVIYDANQQINKFKTALDALKEEIVDEASKAISRSQMPKINLEILKPLLDSRFNTDPFSENLEAIFKLLSKGKNKLLSRDQILRNVFAELNKSKSEEVSNGQLGYVKEEHDIKCILSIQGQWNLRKITFQDSEESLVLKLTWGRMEKVLGTAEEVQNWCLGYQEHIQSTSP